MIRRKSPIGWRFLFRFSDRALSFHRRLLHRGVNRPGRLTAIQLDACPHRPKGKRVSCVDNSHQLLQCTTTYEHDPRAVDPCSREDRNLPVTMRAHPIQLRRGPASAGQTSECATSARHSFVRSWPADTAPSSISQSLATLLPMALRSWAERPSEGLV